MSIRKTAVIGVGNMAGAILSGVFGAKIHEPADFVLYDLDSEKTKRFAQIGCSVADSESDAVRESDRIILAVKPQGFPDLLEKIRNGIDENKLIISIAAGISTQYITERIGKNVPVIRVLPNTPMLMNSGVTAITKNELVNDEDFDYALGIFNSCGSVYEIDEKDFHSIVAVHSSSPAYVFSIAAAMSESAQRRGIDRDVALKMIAETFIGSAKMILESGLSCEELIAMVKSKKGTTEASLNCFEEHDLRGIIDKAMIACADRSRELGSGK